jgi:hypothetical protein
MPPIVAGMLPRRRFAQNAHLLDDISLLRFLCTLMNLPIDVRTRSSFLPEYRWRFPAQAQVDARACRGRCGRLPLRW